MAKNTRFVGLDVHAETIAVAVAEAIRSATQTRGSGQRLIFRCGPPQGVSWAAHALATISLPDDLRILAKVDDGNDDVGLKVLTGNVEDAKRKSVNESSPDRGSTTVKSKGVSRMSEVVSSNSSRKSSPRNGALLL